MPSGLEHVETREVEDGPELEGDAWHILAWSGSGAMSDQEWSSFTLGVEKLVRRSAEYRQYIDWLSGEKDLSRCAILGNVGWTEATVELHHYPFTLHRICAVEASRMAEGGGTDTFSIADEVLRLHYANEVGLVPLCSTMHELSHRHKVFVDLRQVFGRYDRWMESRSEWLGRADRRRMRFLLDKSREGDWVSDDAEFLTWANPAAAKAKGNLARTEELAEIMRKRDATT